jgi:NADH-quinone oxidoreductase subunit L
MHPHEVQPYVLWGMLPLGILAVIFGWYHESFMHFVTKLLPAYEMSEHTHHMTGTLITVTTLIALGGILVAFRLYSHKLKRNEKIENSMPYRVLSNQYYIPIFYERVFSKPYAELSDIAWKEIDMQVVDATVDGIASIVEETGDSARGMQTGNLSDYLKWMAFGLVALAIMAVIVAMKS